MIVRQKLSVWQLRQLESLSKEARMSLIWSTHLSTVVEVEGGLIFRVVVSAPF
jgi:hypothetical protein